MKTCTALHCSLLMGLLMVPSLAAPAMATARPQSPAIAKEGAPADAPIAQHQRDLLHLAWQAASAMPLEPHAKSRSRAQETVALACLNMDQPSLARKFARGIADWRRGSVLADYAHYCADHGHADEALAHITLAEEVADNLGRDEAQQEWRRDTIWLKVASTYAELGRTADAERTHARIEQGSAQAFDAGWAATLTRSVELVERDGLERELQRLDGIVASGGSGEAYSAVAICCRLFDKFYADEELRERIGLRVRTRDSKLPRDLHMSILLEVAKIAARHGDAERGREALAEAAEFLRQSELAPEYRFGYVPVMAEIRHMVGDHGAAEGELEQGLESYHEQRDSFRQTKRAEILRPFAEAFNVIGNRDRAVDLYGMVVEEGMENPNSRPRAHDVSETCLSMAKHGFEPTRELMARIREIVEGLGDPW